MEQGIITLAQADLSAAPADHFKWTIVILIGLVLVGLQVWTAFRQNKTSLSPDPLRVEKFDKFATRDFCEMKHTEVLRQQSDRDREVNRRLDGHDKDVRALYDEMKRNMQTNQEHASKRSETIFQKIEEVRTELSDKIDSTPDRVISTLSNLGLLKKPGEH